MLNIFSNTNILITQFYDERILIKDETSSVIFIVDTVANGSMLNLPGISYSNNNFGYF